MSYLLGTLLRNLQMLYSLATVTAVVPIVVTALIRSIYIYIYIYIYMWNLQANNGGNWHHAPFLSTGHCEFNGASLYAQVQKTIFIQSIISTFNQE